VIVNGWTLYVSDVFERQLENLISEVEMIPVQNLSNHPKFKLLLAIQDNIYNKIPDNAKYRLGKTLGKTHTHWRRLKKNNLPDRYRLFFQFRSDSKSIIYGWFNDESTQCLSPVGLTTRYRAWF
jgi:toxin YhaV